MIVGIFSTFTRPPALFEYPLAGPYKMGLPDRPILDEIAISFIPHIRWTCNVDRLPLPVILKNFKSILSSWLDSHFTLMTLRL